jgi:hypothetical protein
VGPRTGLNDMEKWKFFPPPGLELRTLGSPPRSQSLYRLRYPSSNNNNNNNFILLSLFVVSITTFQEVGIACWYSNELRGARPEFDSRQCKIFLYSTASRPALMLTRLLSNDHWVLFPWGLSERNLKLTTHLHLVPRSRMSELYLHSPIRFNSMVFNYLINDRDSFTFLWHFL